jgi:transketolase
MRHLKIDDVTSVTINKDINERRIKLLASPISSISRQQFSVGVSIVGPGKIHEEHRHEGSEEIVICIGGEGLAKIAGHEFPVGYGSVIGIDQGEPHQFLNTGQQPLTLLWIYDPPGAERKFVPKAPESIDRNKVEELKRFATEIRLATLREFRVLGFGHIGGSMSVVELLAVLYGGVMNIDPENPRWENRDWLVMSKGHAGPALYATLALKGFFPAEELLTLNQAKTRFPSHCDRNRTPGVDMTTGSLGQGMSTAIGVALGNRLDGRKSYTYLILGDGECDEGQVWEGALFASHRNLSNLIAFIDYNKQQLDGYTKDICDLGNLAAKFATFNWFVQDIDGGDVEQIYAAIQRAKSQQKQPSMIVLNTEKGKGCSFAEHQLYNHHMTFTKEQVDEAIAILEAGLKGGTEK